MKYQEAFTKKYKISASELLEQISTKFFGNIKRIGLEKLIDEQVKEKGIDPNKEFYKMLIEAIAEGNIKLPENQKLSIESTRFEIPNQEVSIPKSKGVLQDFKEIVSTDDLRPVMMGVYVSEDGFLVATDAHILVKYQSNEFSKEKGKIIDLKKYIGTKGKALDFIDEKYPNYDAVIPQNNEHKFKGLSTYAFYNFAKSTLFLKKLTTSVVFTIEFVVKGEKYYINPNLFSDLLEFALAKGFTSFDFEIDDSKSRALVLRFEQESIGLIMPILAQESNGTIGYTFDQIENEFGSSKSIGKKKALAPKSIATKSIAEAPKSVAKYKKFEGDIENTEYISRREIASITLRSGEVLSGNDIIDGIYRAKKKFAKGGEFVQLPPKGELTNRDNLLLKYQKVGSNYEFYIYEPIVKKVSGYNQTKYVCKNSDCALKMNYKEFINYLYSELYLDDKKFAKGGEIESLKVGSKIGFLRPQTGRYEYAEVLSIDENNVNLVVRHPKKVYLDNYFTETKERISKFSNTPSEDWKDGRPVVKIKYAKGGKIGFEGLAKKVAKRYIGKKVSKEYQAEYGKTYDAKEAKEVGNKVAGKVYKQQVAKKKIVRKLQRKTK